MTSWDAGSRSLDVPVVGRDAERLLLRSCIDRVATGRGLATVIEGDAGIGKSRLVHDCLAAAAATGFHVWSSAGHELARERPFGMLTEALAVVRSSPDRPRAQLARLLATEPATAGGLRFRILDDLLELVERGAQAGPCVLALDDLQWADPSTLLAVDHLLPRTTAVPVLLVIACRPAPRSRELAATLDLARSLGDRHIVLRPLAHHDIRQLVMSALTAEPGPRLDTLVAGCGGNPFFVLELLAVLDEEDAITRDAGMAETALAEAPPSVRQLVLRRLRFLSDAGFELLRVASVLGSMFSLADLATVASRPAMEILPVLTELVSTGVVGEAGKQFRFGHDLVREAVYDDIPRPARRDLHREAGRRLAEAGASTESIATQMALGASDGDAEAVAYLRRAAAEAQCRGPRVASGLLERAIEVVGADTDTEAALASELVQSLLWAGDHARAVDIAREALGFAGRPRQLAPAVEGRIRLALGQALLFRGAMVDAGRELELATNLCDRWDAAAAAAVASAAALLAGDIERAVRMAEHGLALGGDTDDDSACLALTMLAWAADLRGRLAESTELVDRALRRATSADQRALPFGGPHGVLGVFLASSGHRDAARMLHKGRAHAETSGAVYDLPTFHAATAMLGLWEGNFEDALAEIDTGLTWWREHGSSLGIVWPLAMRAYIQLRRDEHTAAAETLRTAEQEVLNGGAQFNQGWLLHVRALLAEAKGDVDAAAAALEAGWAIAQALGAVSIGVEIGPDLTRLLLARERPEPAVALADTLVDLAAQGDFPLVKGSALRCQGLVERDPALLVEATEVLEQGPRPLLAAFAA